MAVVADLAHPGVSPVLDVFVATMFVAAALFATGPERQRWLMAGVGAAWLLGSWLPGAILVHQGVLVLALLVYPSGSLRGLDWLFAATAIPVAAGAVPKIGVVAAFGVVAARRGVSRRDIDRVYPVVSAAAIAGFMGFSWFTETLFADAFDPQLIDLGWQALLAVIACAFPVATRVGSRRHSRLADVMFDGESTGGLKGLELVLAETLGDSSLRVRTLPEASDSAPRSHIRIRDGDRLLAVVEHRPGLLDDPVLARGVSDAVRLSVTSVELRREEVQRLKELEASRSRLLAATDRTRSRMAVELLRDVQAPLRDVASRVDRISPALPTGSRKIIMDELARVDGAVSALLAGVPADRMGRGGLKVALQRLARSSTVPVSVSAPEDAVADADVETVLFYVCSEALTNAVKHADAQAVQVDLDRQGDGLWVRVSDDGRGGADAGGSGLRGLADRLAASGGRLQVESAPGAGTVVTAVVPVLTQSSSTA
jgi:signal transduction histidine kinase